MFSALSCLVTVWSLSSLSRRTREFKIFFPVVILAIYILSPLLASCLCTSLMALTSRQASSLKRVIYSNSIHYALVIIVWTRQRASQLAYHTSDRSPIAKQCLSPSVRTWLLVTQHAQMPEHLGRLQFPSLTNKISTLPSVHPYAF